MFFMKNPVAKFMNKFNKSYAMKDKTKYTREKKKSWLDDYQHGDSQPFDKAKSFLNY